MINLKKILPIAAAVLIAILFGGCGWLYLQTRDLKADLDSANSAKNAATSAKETAEASLASLKSGLSEKVELLVIFMHYSDDASKLTRAKELIVAIDDTTLTADWNLMEQTGSAESGAKILKDLTSLIAKDVGVTAP